MYEKIKEKYGEKIVDEAGIIHDSIMDGLYPHYLDLDKLRYWKYSDVFNVVLDMLGETLESKGNDLG